MKKIEKEQSWATTGGIRHYELLQGFFGFETQPLDAPFFCPSGSTVENDVTKFNLGVVVIGGLANRFPIR